MAFFERKWVIALSLLIVIVGFNGISGWLAFRGKALETAETVSEIPAKTEDLNTTPPETVPATVTVHICGAVSSPGSSYSRREAGSRMLWSRRRVFSESRHRQRQSG